MEPCVSFKAFLGANPLLVWKKLFCRFYGIIDLLESIVAFVYLKLSFWKLELFEKYIMFDLFITGVCN